MSTFADSITDIPEERELINTAHKWLIAYRNLNNPGNVAPMPTGTRYEAWAILTMVSMFYGVSEMFPALQVREAVPTPPDFLVRLVAMVGRLETDA